MIRRLNEGLQNEEWFNKQLNKANMNLTDIIDIVEELRVQLSQYAEDVQDEVSMSDDPERLLMLAGNLVSKANRKLEEVKGTLSGSDVYFDLYYYKHGGTD